MTLLRGARSLLSVLLVGLYFVLGSPVLRLLVLPGAWLFPGQRFRLVSLYMKGMSYGIEALLTLGGARFRQVGTIPTREPVLVVANHQSLIDILQITIMSRPRVPGYVTRTRYGRFVPLVSACVRLLGGPLIDPRNDPRGAVLEIRRAAERLPHGLMIFPEGHRSTDGAVRPFRSAGIEAILAARRLPVYLVLNEGVWRVRRFTDLLFRVHLIDAVSEVSGPYEPPADPAALPAFALELREKLVARLAELRRQGAAARLRTSAGGVDLLHSVEVRMARRLVIASQKGGVGKTTVALNLAVALAERGRRTLLVDLDPQGAIGLSLAKGDTELAGLAELLSGVAGADEALLRTQLDGLSLLPRGRLDATDVDAFEREVSYDGALDRALAACESAVDVVVVDTPSGLGRVTTAALAASHFVVLAFQAETLSLRSIGQALTVVEHVQATRNPRLRLAGILPTLVERERAGTQAVLAEIWSGFPDALETVVPRSEAFAQASSLGVPVAFLGGQAGSPEARRFDLLSDELEVRMNRLDGMERIHEAQPARQLL